MSTSPQRAGGLPRVKSRGFTLLELIIVIAILAILSVAVVLVINPAETLRRGRDSTRLSDLVSVKSAIALYATEVTTLDMDGAGACGTNVWTSSPTGLTDATLCGAATVAILENTSGAVDGTGWLPVPLTAMPATIGSPLSNYPVDPINTINGTTLEDADGADLIYVYQCTSATSPFFEVNGRLESATNDGKESGDGGDNASIYEIGTDPGLNLCSTWL